MPEQTRGFLAGALDGNEQARGQLLDRVRARLELWVATRLSAALRSRVEPDDVVQETLLAVHKGLDDFSGDDRAFLGWMFKIAENRIRDLAAHFAAKKRQAVDLTPRDQTTPSYAAGRNEWAVRIRNALVHLSEPHQQVIQLRRFEELDIAEIAKVMERSENATRILYCRAIQALRDEMKR